MKTHLKKLLLLTISLICWNVQAQDLDEIISSDYLILFMNYVNNEEFICQEANTLTKFNNDGELLDSNIIPIGRLVNLSRTTNGNFNIISTTVSNDTTYFHKTSVHDDLNMTYDGVIWYETERVNGALNDYNVCYTADTSIILSYGLFGSNQDESRFKAIKLDAEGLLVGEQIFPRCAKASWYHNMLPSNDSLGCRVIAGRKDEPWWLAYDCYTLDAQMNIVDVKENIENLSYPYVPCSGYYRLNPHNGRIYSIGDFYQNIDGGFTPIDLTRNHIMSVYDSDFNQLNYRRCPWLTKTGNEASMLYTIDFGPENEVYMLGGMDIFNAFTQNLYIACFDEDLNVIGELYYKDPKRFLQYLNIAASPQGGCVVSCQDMYTGKCHVYKVTMSDFLNVEEAHANGFAAAMAYPNPGNNQLNIRTALPNSRVEVYDINGKLLHNQQITDVVTSINSENWPSGIYIWKVFSGNKEAECGKWVKE